MIRLDQIAAAVFVVAVRGDSFTYELVNPEFERLTGLDAQRMLGRPPDEVFAAPVAETVTSAYRQCVAFRAVQEYERTIDMPKGRLVIRTVLTPIIDEAGGPVRRLLGMVIDVTEQHRLREDLRQSQARLAVALEAMGGAPWFYDVTHNSFELGEGFDRILGPSLHRQMRLDEWLGHIHPDDRDDTCFADILSGEKATGTAEFRAIASNGDLRWLRCQHRGVRGQGGVTGIAGIIVDITQDKRREAVLSRQASSDPLTGLDNRRRFDQTLASARSDAARRGGALSLLMVDVDYFKRFNDTYGHVAGDAVLKRVARCLRAVVVKAGGTAARYGGEEFVAVLPGLSTAEAAPVAAAMLDAVAALRQPSQASPTGWLSVSIGLAGHPAGAADPEVDLLDMADAALYRAKQDGRGRYRVRVPATPEAAWHQAEPRIAPAA